MRASTTPRRRPPTLPEAPVSITLKGTLHGQDVMVTLRGLDFASVKAHVEQAAQWLQAGAPATPPAPQCPIHKVPMKENQKNGRIWLSHKTPEGWCKGR
jgi:hypothetical protein